MNNSFKPRYQQVDLGKGVIINASISAGNVTLGSLVGDGIESTVKSTQNLRFANKVQNLVDWSSTANKILINSMSKSQAPTELSSTLGSITGNTFANYSPTIQKLIPDF